MGIIDISPVIRKGIGVWPGDVPFAMDKALDIDAGAHMDLGSMHTTFHVGAHSDAHRHYVQGGADAASMPLEPYLGECQVIEVAATRGERFHMQHLQSPVSAKRVLLKTGTFPDPESWNNDFAAPAPEVIDHLADNGVILIGFDTPSTDLYSSKDLAAHKRLAARQMVNLEGLVLGHVEAGHYNLSALPLRLEGADASPVRAVLW